VAAGAGPPLSGAGVRGALPLRAQAPSACTGCAQLLVRGSAGCSQQAITLHVMHACSPIVQSQDLALYKHGSAELLAR